MKSIVPGFLAQVFAALFVSQDWATYGDLTPNRRLYARTRAVVVFDRVLNGDLRRWESRALSAQGARDE